MPLVMSPLITSQYYQRHMMKQLVRSLGQETSILLKTQLQSVLGSTPSDTRIGNTDTSISDMNIITNNINKFSTRKRAYPALDVANPKVTNRVDTIPTRKSLRISSHARDNDIAKCKVATHWQLP